MFAPPVVLSTRVFAELPAALSLAGQSSDWLFGKDKADHGAFLEGPVFDPAGNLYVVDIAFGRIFRIAPDGVFSVVVRYDGEPNGMARAADGRLFIADHRRGVLALDLASGQVEPVLTRVRREGFKGTNDLIFAANGDMYFTDQGQTGLQDPTGRLYRRRAADGRLECLLDNVPSPNGLVLTPDEKALFLAVTRANQIWRVPLHADGAVGKVSLFIQLQGGLTGPDGLAMDATGRLAVAHCGMGVVWVFSRLGEPLYRINSCRGLSTSNLCFGADGRTLYITESDSSTILTAELPLV